MLVNAYCTNRSPPELSFPHTLRSRRDRTDPELAKHLQGFMGFVTARGKRPMTQMRYHVLRHLERVVHHVALEVDDAHMDDFAAWASRANAIVFLPDSTVCDPRGKVLVAPDTGDPEPDAEMPYPKDGVERKTRTEQELASREIRTPASLPAIVSEVEVDLRSPSEVALRCFALFACAVRAESLASKDPIPQRELRAKLPLAYDAMSPSEKAFFDHAKPPKQQVVNHVWRYEALALLHWALGASDDLPFPEGICDVPALAKAMVKADDSFVSEARLRPAGEVLDALDLHYRLHWAVTEARVRQQPPIKGIEAGVVAERHYALNWLTRFEDADWDDVQTPT
jgi:hypothetical protein